MNSQYMKWRAQQSARIEQALIARDTPDLSAQSGNDPMASRICQGCTELQDLCPRCEALLEAYFHCGGDCGDCIGCKPSPRVAAPAGTNLCESCSNSRCPIETRQAVACVEFKGATP